MAEKLDPRQVVAFEELIQAMMFETEATRRVLVRKGLYERGGAGGDQGGTAGDGRD